MITHQWTVFNEAQANWVTQPRALLALLTLIILNGVVCSLCPDGRNEFELTDQLTWQHSHILWQLYLLFHRRIILNIKPSVSSIFKKCIWWQYYLESAIPKSKKLRKKSLYLLRKVCSLMLKLQKLINYSLIRVLISYCFDELLNGLTY